MTSDIGFALLLSALAGLSTTVGSPLGLFVHRPAPRFMTLTLGFSAGPIKCGQVFVGENR